MLKVEIQKIKNLIKLTDYQKALSLVEKLKSNNYYSLEIEEIEAFLNLKTENYSKAYEIYKNLISKNENNEIYIKGLIESSIFNNNLGEAEEILNKYDITKSNPEYFYYRGLISLKKGNYEEALKFYLSYLKHFPDNEKIYNDIGIIYKNMGNFKEAINFFLKGIRIDPNYFLTNYNLAIVYFQIGNYDKAEFYFKKALKINKNFPEIYNYLGMIDIHNKRYDKAFKNLNKALEKDPDNLNVKNNLAILYDYTNNVSKAEELYKELINKNKDNYIYYLNLANILNRENKFDESLSYLSIGLKKFPNNSKILSKIGDTYYLANNKNEALKYFNKSLQIQPDNIDSLKGIASILYENGDLKSSLNYYLKALEYKSDDINIFFNIANIYYNLKDYEKAIFYYNKIIKIDPNNVDALLKLGQLYIDLKSYNEGFKILNKVKSIEPDNIYPYLILGDYYKNNNMIKEAIDEYSNVLNIKSLRSGSNLSIFNNTLEEYEKLLKKLNKDKIDKLFEIQQKFKDKFGKKDNLLGKEAILSDDISKIEKSFEFENIGTLIDEIDNINFEDLKEEIVQEIKEEKEDYENKDLFDLGGVLNRKKLSEDEDFNFEEEKEEFAEKEGKEEDKEEEKIKEIFNIGDLGKNKLSDDNYDRQILDKLGELKKDLNKISSHQDENMLSKYSDFDVPSTFEEKYRIEDSYEEKPIIAPKTIKSPYFKDENKYNIDKNNKEEFAASKSEFIPSQQRDNFSNQNIPPINVQISTPPNVSQPLQTIIQQPIQQPQYVSPSVIQPSVANPQISHPAQPIIPSINNEIPATPKYDNIYSSAKSEVNKDDIKEIFNELKSGLKDIYNDLKNKQNLSNEIPNKYYEPQYSTQQQPNIYDNYNKGLNYPEKSYNEPEKKEQNVKENDNIKEDINNQEELNQNEVILNNEEQKIEEILNGNWNDKNEKINLITNSLKILGKYFNESLLNLPPEQKLEIIADEKYKKLLKFIRE